jgi:hypothetical protein
MSISFHHISMCVMGGLSYSYLEYYGQVRNVTLNLRLDPGTAAFEPFRNPCFPPFTVELAMIMDRLYGGVCYAGIDTDPELKYPKGAGRVAFSNQQSYIAAISARFVQLQHGEIDKRVGVLYEVFLSSLSGKCSITHTSMRKDRNDVQNR